LLPARGLQDGFLGFYVMDGLTKFQSPQLFPATAVKSEESSFIENIIKKLGSCKRT
jgi:hypothetical protein